MCNLFKKSCQKDKEKEGGTPQCVLYFYLWPGGTFRHFTSLKPFHFLINMVIVDGEKSIFPCSLVTYITLFVTVKKADRVEPPAHEKITRFCVI